MTLKTLYPSRNANQRLLFFSKQTETHGGKWSDVTLQQSEEVPEEYEKGTLKVSMQDSEKDSRADAKTAFWVRFARSLTRRTFQVSRVSK